MGSASPFDEFAPGTVGGTDQGVLWALGFTDPDSTGPPPAMIEAGLHPDDLALWPPALDQHPTAVGGPTEPAVAWSVLANKINALNGIAPWLTLHDALAWLIADMPAVTDLIGSGTLLMSWASITSHGWLPHAAGLTPAEYETNPLPERELRVMAGLRGHTLPPFRSPEPDQG